MYRVLFDWGVTSRKPILSAIRELCRAHLPGYEGSRCYGMTTYSRNGEAEFAFASQKRRLPLYGMKWSALDPLRWVSVHSPMSS